MVVDKSSERVRRMFGDDVHQAGSLVHAPNLRFDFTFGRALTGDELSRLFRRSMQIGSGTPEPAPAPAT